MQDFFADVDELLREEGVVDGPRGPGNHPFVVRVPDEASRPTRPAAIDVRVDGELWEKLLAEDDVNGDVLIHRALRMYAVVREYATRDTAGNPVVVIGGEDGERTIHFI